MIRRPITGFPGNAFGEVAMLSGDNGLPSTPALSTPADGATVAHASFAPTWTAARRATSYDLQTATDAGFTTAVVTTNVAALTLNPGLSAATYYYRVRGVNRHGNGAWSTARSVILS